MCSGPHFSAHFILPSWPCLVLVLSAEQRMTIPLQRHCHHPMLEARVLRQQGVAWTPGWRCPLHSGDTCTPGFSQWDPREALSTLW